MYGLPTAIEHAYPKACPVMSILLARDLSGSDVGTQEAL